MGTMSSSRRRKVFLDANVVIRAGRPPGGLLIPRVVDLVDAGYVKAVTTDLTKMEVAKKHAANDFEVIGHLTKRRVRDLADEILDIKLPGISPTELHQKLLGKYQNSVEDMFRSLRAETISIDSVKPGTDQSMCARSCGAPRLPPPRLARGVTGIAGGLALGFQGDFLGRPPASAALFRTASSASAAAFRATSSAAWRFASASRRALSTTRAALRASRAWLVASRAACCSMTAASSTRGRARNFSSAACLAFAAVLSRSLKSSPFLNVLINQFPFV
jgi:hypothetical protein